MIFILDILFTDGQSMTWVTVSDEENATPNDDNICNEIINGYKEVMTITCNYNDRNPPMLRGRYVTIRQKENANEEFKMNFCEVEVLSCPPGRWGYGSGSFQDCLQACDRCRNVSETCRVSDGYCFTRCQEGYYAGSCDKQCNCVDDEPCSRLDGHCEGGCQEGYHGGSCDEECHCQDGAPCNQTDGSCPPGIKLIKNYSVINLSQIGTLCALEVNCDGNR